MPNDSDRRAQLVRDFDAATDQAEKTRIRAEIQAIDDARRDAALQAGVNAAGQIDRNLAALDDVENEQPLDAASALGREADRLGRRP